MPRQMTVTQAAAALRVSRRTVERRIASGAYPVAHEGNHRIVTVPDEVLLSEKMAWTADDKTAQSATGTDSAQVATVPAAVQIAALSAELAAVKAERDKWYNLVIEQSRDLAHLAEQRALEAPRAVPGQPGVWQRVRQWFAGAPPDPRRH